jgi:hypothetical protein
LSTTSMVGAAWSMLGFALGELPVRAAAVPLLHQ